MNYNIESEINNKYHLYKSQLSPSDIDIKHELLFKNLLELFEFDHDKPQGDYYDSSKAWVKSYGTRCLKYLSDLCKKVDMNSLESMKQYHKIWFHFGIIKDLYERYNFPVPRELIYMDTPINSKGFEILLKFEKMPNHNDIIDEVDDYILFWRYTGSSKGYVTKSTKYLTEMLNYIKQDPKRETTDFKLYFVNLYNCREEARGF